MCPCLQLLRGQHRPTQGANAEYMETTGMGCQRVCKLQWRKRRGKWLLLPIVLRGLWSTKSEAAGQRLLAGRGMWGWLEAALPAGLLPHTRSSLAEAGGQLWLLVTLQILGPLSTLVVHLTELLNAAAGLQDHLFRHGDHHAEEVWVLKALK